MMSTEANAIVASTARGSGPTTYHTTHVTTAIARTAGTKTPEIRSASFWIGGLDAWACSTSRTIWASAVSLPTAVAFISKAPSPLDVPPSTRSPGDFSTGIDSPVIIDSSTAERPDATTPSTGTESPGLTRRSAPGTTSASGTSRSARFGLWTSTGGRSSGARSSRARMAAEVLPRARVSRYRPRRTSVRITPTAS